MDSRIYNIIVRKCAECSRAAYLTYSHRARGEWRTANSREQEDEALPTNLVPVLESGPNLLSHLSAPPTRFVRTVTTNRS